MEKNIQIFDNIVPIDIVNNYENLLLNSKNFPFYYSNNITDFSSDKFLPGIFHELSLEKDIKSPYFYEFAKILYYLCDHINFKLYNIIASRLFMDLPSPNPQTDSIPHVDKHFPHWVCLYYVNDSDGDTVLYENNKKTEIQRVSPKKGRIVFFDGTIPHSGSTSSKHTRAVVNFNFHGEKL